MKKSRVLFIASIFVLFVSLNSFGQQSVSVRIGNFVVADRNVGARVPQGGVALNYTNDTTHADHKNFLFKGDYYTWEEAQTACPRGWRLPTRDEWKVINSKMQFSNGIAYLEDGTNRCYFPLSGASFRPAYVSGDYWASTKGDGLYAWCLHLYTNKSSVYYNNYRVHGFSVRCVKTVSSSKQTSIPSSSNANGYFIIGNIQVSDRNVGAKVPQGGVALNYTNIAKHTDHQNLSFKGDYYTWDKAQTACPSGWQLPTKAELEVIGSKMQFSNGLAYLKDGAGNKCYFPLSGSSRRPASVKGYYWSGTGNENNDRFAWSLYVSTRFSSMNSNSFLSEEFSIRCVKTVE